MFKIATFRRFKRQKKIRYPYKKLIIFPPKSKQIYFSMETIFLNVQIIQ